MRIGATEPKRKNNRCFVPARTCLVDFIRYALRQNPRKGRGVFPGDELLAEIKDPIKTKFRGDFSEPANFDYLCREVIKALDSYNIGAFPVTDAIRNHRIQDVLGWDDTRLYPVVASSRKTPYTCLLAAMSGQDGNVFDAYRCIQENRQILSRIVAGEKQVDREVINKRLTVEIATLRASRLDLFKRRAALRIDSSVLQLKLFCEEQLGVAEEDNVAA